MERRLFLQALAASVVAAGAALPVGFPREWRKHVNVEPSSTLWPTWEQKFYVEYVAEYHGPPLVRFAGRDNVMAS